MKIYLDNCCFNRPFDSQEQTKIRLEAEAKLHIQNQINNGEHEMIWSYILEYENMQNPYEDRRSNTMEWKAVAAIEITENEDIISAAETLQAMGIKTKDSLHIACAVAGNADYFLTTDKKLLNSADSVSEVKIRNPLEFISAEG